MDRWNAKVNEWNDVVRKFKGYYFLNIRCDKEQWIVKKIKLSHGQLTISEISIKADLDNLKEITETPQDTIPRYNFTATKKQFSKFIQHKGFSDSEVFIRQK